MKPNLTKYYPPGAIVEYEPVHVPNPHHPTHVEAGIIAALVFLVGIALGYGGYWGYHAIYDAGRDSMRQAITDSMQAQGLTFCRKDPLTTEPQVYNNYTMPQGGHN